MRRGNGRCGGGFGGDGSGGGASAAAETKQLGFYDKKSTPELEPARRQATLDFGVWWTPLTA